MDTSFIDFILKSEVHTSSHIQTLAMATVTKAIDTPFLRYKQKNAIQIKTICYLGIQT